MASDGSDFADVLKEAQRLGYAERNPEADVEGYDACRKIAILSSLAYGKEVNYEEVYTEGITKITAEDIKYATSMGTAIKLLATSRKVGNQYYAMVSPVMIDAKNPLYSVNGVFNAIFIHGNVLGDAMFYGSGAEASDRKCRCSRCRRLRKEQRQKHHDELERGKTGPAADR